jgi:2',3'-cyclic-nucleotide 2'-phosphodiesterase (5'-nucleotidase family)
VTPDPEIAALVKSYEDKLSKELDVAVGTTETPLDSRRATVRGGEAAIGNLIADALKAATGADVAITNGGGIRADKQYEAGQTLTRRDILAEMPFGNTTVLLELPGEKIKAALENGVSEVRELAGRFPQVSGIVAEVDLKAPVGERVKSVKINGEPLDPARTYKVATNDFMARGGDGYRAFIGAKSLIDISASQLMASQVIDYVEKAKKVAPKVEGRVVLR